jgi:hypothetical protein
MGIRYISGTPDQDVGVDTNNELPKNVVGGAAEESENVSSQEKKELSSVGISLLAIGSVFIVSMILVGIKKSIGDNRAFETYDEFYDDDQDLNKEWKNENGENNNGDDTSLNDTMGSISSNDSQKTGRLAMIYNEEESVNNTTCSIIRELQASEAYAASHGIHDNDGSSTRRPVFVSTRDDEIVEIYGVNTSIYTQSSELTKPTFENPARLGNERNYSVDDTVEF